MTSSSNRLFKKFRDTSTVDRHQGSGRMQSTRTDEKPGKRYVSESRGPEL